MTFLFKGFVWVCSMSWGALSAALEQETAGKLVCDCGNNSLYVGFLSSDSLHTLPSGKTRQRLIHFFTDNRQRQLHMARWSLLTVLLNSPALIEAMMRMISIRCQVSVITWQIWLASGRENFPGPVLHESMNTAIRTQKKMREREQTTKLKKKPQIW